jgi:adenine phosphoribosyltransferase
MDLKQYIRDVENFPKEGISFKDITPLLADTNAFQFVIDAFCQKLGDADVIV